MTTPTIDPEKLSAEIAADAEVLQALAENGDIATLVRPVDLHFKGSQEAIEAQANLVTGSTAQMMQILAALGPGNPAADADGKVKLPNVNSLTELADLREAGRSYEANLQMIKQTRSMVNMTIDLLRAQG